MAWVKGKYNPRKGRVKRFSSATIKTKEKGPSTATVFPGGRLIPEDAKDAFAYRHRGMTMGLSTDELIERISQHERALTFFGFPTGKWAEADKKYYWDQLKVKWAKDADRSLAPMLASESPLVTSMSKDPKLLTELRLEQLQQPNLFPTDLDQVEQLTVLWQSEFRQRMHHWNYVRLPLRERVSYCPNDYLRMYFEGLQFIFMERDDRVWRRSVIYPSREKALRAYGYNRILWINKLDIDSSASPVHAPHAPDV